MEKHCKICDSIKEVEKFYKASARVCKDCRNKLRRTNKPNKGRFVKGQIPWMSGKKHSQESLEKMSVSRRGIGKGRWTFKYHEWRKKVLERDGYKCSKCGSQKRLHCHHIKPWKKYEELRFDSDNGRVLCCSCHITLEKTGQIVTHETRRKISKKLQDNKNGLGISKNKPPWNKGLRKKKDGIS